MSAETLDQLNKSLEDVTLEFKHVLYEPTDLVTSVYFVETGVVSIITPLEDGTTVETSTVGNEGLVGLPIFLESGRATDRALCQIAGTATRVDASVIDAERRRGNSDLVRLALRYTSAVIAMTAQTAACNRMHPVEERMSRWLLMMVDRVGRPDFALTQEFLATMLGVRRPTINIAGATLQKAGLIRYKRGQITVVDREGLEAAACECYVRIRDEFARALGGNGQP